MNLRSSPLVLPLAAALLLGGLVPEARGQVVINEMVYDIAGEAPDVREYVETLARHAPFFAQALQEEAP